MRTYLDCIPCFFEQALKAARLAGANENVQKRILDSLALEVPDFPLSSSPPEMGRIVYRLVREITGEEDPFKRIKDEYNKIALNIYPDLKEKVAHSRDRLLAAIRLALAGNVINFAKPNLKACLGEDFCRAI